MKRIFALTLGVAVLTGSAYAQSNMQGTIWVGTSLLYESPYKAEHGYAWTLGFAPVVVDKNTGNNNDTEYGIAGEGVFYQDKQPRGTAFVARVGLVDGGLYGAPGIMAVNRPMDPRKVSYRFGVLAVLGSIDNGDLLPWTLELAAGFRF